MLSLPVWLSTSSPKATPALSALQNPEVKENSHSGGFLTWSGLFFFASGFPTRCILVPLPPTQTFFFSAFSRQRLQTLIFKLRLRWKAWKRTDLSPPVHLLLWQLFFVVFTFVRQCSSFTCQLQCESYKIPCLCRGLLFFFLMAALIKKINNNGREGERKIFLPLAPFPLVAGRLPALALVNEEFVFIGEGKNMLGK